MQQDRNGNFTYKSYREMLQAFANKNYTFEFFQNAASLLAEKKLFVLLRHDIDVELEKALKIAQIENELNIKSTYFFLLRTQHYNVFSSENTEIIKEILSLGHQPGIHFDCSAYPELFESLHLNPLECNENHSLELQMLEAKKKACLPDACKTEAAIFESWFKNKISIISYHRPGKFVLSNNEQISGGFLHTYLPIFTDQIEYKADSRGLWRFGNPLGSQAFKNSQPMQINIHPIWWSEVERSANQALLDALKMKKLNLQQSFTENFTIFKPDELPS